jgi:hypothetical protein
MDSEKLNRWMTLGANIGVLAGIIFLAFEMRQNTVATQLEAASNFQSSFSEIELLIASNPEFAELLRKGREGEDASATEQLRLSVFYNNVLRQWQFNHFQSLSDALSAEMWEANRAFMANTIGEDRGLFRHWQRNRSHFNPEFNEVIESITVELE